MSFISLILGCAGRPTTEQMTGLDTARISEAIRCEMRDAFITLLVEALQSSEANDQIAAGVSRRHFMAMKMPAGLQEDENVWKARQESDAFETFLTKAYKNVPGARQEVVQVVETYGKAFIAYKFVFDMTQTDGLEASVDLLSIVSRGTVTTSLGGSFEGKRQAKREFVVADRVDELLTNLPTIRECNRFRREQKGEAVPNGAYPIAGKIGLEQIVRNFVTANQSGNLIGQLSDTEILTASDKVPLPTMSERLIFSTTLKGGISPRLELSAPARGTDVETAMFTANRERLDIHTLILVMQLPSLRGATVAQTRSDAERRRDAEYRRQATQSARELNRLEEQDENRRAIDIITGR